MFPLILSPFSAIAAGLTARRVARPGFTAPVPVICCGNVTLGGAGKTTLALDLAQHLERAGVAVHFLTRGYGGRLAGPLRVEDAHDAAAVGDEALLLAATAPTWIGADRAASARAAIKAGAEALVMDDGMQNPTLHKSFTFMIIDGEFGFGNGHVLPAGPLREPVQAAARRAQAAVLIGPDRHGARRLLAPALPLLTARLVPGPEAAMLSGRRVVAFAGIARPEKFFASLEEVRAVLVARHSYPDHHRYRPAEVARLIGEAERLDALPVTTAKDTVRLPAALRQRVSVLSVSLAWDDPAALSALLSPLFPTMSRA